MANVSRNDPCPCGSGKKYKKCCMPRDRAESGQREHEETTPYQPLSQGVFVETDIDRLSNRALDLTNADRLDEAEAACMELLKRFPGHVDGLERIAEVYKRKGDNLKAVVYLRKAARFMQTRPGDYDDEFIQSLLHEADEIEASMNQQHS